MLLEVCELAKRFGVTAALEGVTFDVRGGEVLGLIGPNGSGKTTLFECIAGLSPVDRGEFRTNGALLSEVARQRTLFYIPDGIAPWEAQPVAWVLRLFEAMHGSTAGRLEELVRDLNLGTLLDRPVGVLSRGQRKRVLLALGLLTPHPLLLLDEPFEGLDVRQVRDASALLRSHAALGRTLFLSMHQLHDAERVCDRMVLLSGGRMVGSGSMGVLRDAVGLPTASLEEVFLALT